MNKKHIITGVIILLSISIIVIASINKKMLPDYAKSQLELNSIREDMEYIGYKDFAYSECVTESSFVKMLFPWSFKEMITDVENKTDFCGKKLIEFSKNN